MFIHLKNFKKKQKNIEYLIIIPTHISTNISQFQYIAIWLHNLVEMRSKMSRYVRYQLTLVQRIRCRGYHLETRHHLRVLC